MNNGAETKRHGYSLLELILAMALMVVVMSGIAGAINIYMVQVAKQQARVERELISRNALAMMARDVRAAVQYKAADYGGVDTLLESLALMTSGNTGANTGGEEDEDEPAIDEEMVSFRPTLFGTSNAIMLDISHLPRLDQYNPLLVVRPSEEQATFSDIKSISYFFSSQSGGYDPKVVRRESEIAGGMYRREIDRAVASFRGDSSLQIRPDEFAELVASEVAELGFRYFDGQNWADSWDSEEAGGFPTAIEISLVVDPQRTATGSTSYQYNGFDASAMERHQLTVFLPTAEPEPEEEEE